MAKVLGIWIMDDLITWSLKVQYSDVSIIEMFTVHIPLHWKHLNTVGIWIATSSVFRSCGFVCLSNGSLFRCLVPGSDHYLLFRMVFILDGIWILVRYSNVILQLELLKPFGFQTSLLAYPLLYRYTVDSGAFWNPDHSKSEYWNVQISNGFGI